MASLIDIIRESAIRHGVDPDIAVRVARSEGGLTDPVRQSDVMKNGRREPSYGPFQLLVGGGDTGFPSGLGNRFMEQTGLDPRDPANAAAGIDYAMSTAAKSGWGQWYGAKNSGIGNWQGIGGRQSSEPMAQSNIDLSSSTPATSTAAPHQSAMGRLFNPQSDADKLMGFLGRLTSASAQNTASDVPVAVQNLANGGSSQKSPLANIFGALALSQQQQQPQFAPAQIRGPTAEQANALNNLLQSLRGRMA